MFTIGTVWKTLSNNYGKRFPPLLRVFSATPTVVNYSVGNGFNDAFPGNSSTQNELKSKKMIMLIIIRGNEHVYDHTSVCLEKSGHVSQSLSMPPSES